MNVYFYAAGSSGSEKQCLDVLLNIPDLYGIHVLSGESPFLSPLSLDLRSGDLLILFVANESELNELIALHDEIASFRIILILAENDCNMVRKAQVIHPSFITFPDDKAVTLEAVIKKICGITPRCPAVRRYVG